MTNEQTGGPDILVMSRPAACSMRMSAPYIVVSIVDPGEDDALLPDSPLCRGVLKLSFDDAEYKGQTPRGKQLISEQDADAILRFVRAYVGAGVPESQRAATIVCQCEMGRSRSAGVAAALSHILNGDDASYFDDYTPNLWVYKTVLQRHEQDGEAQNMNTEAAVNTHRAAQQQPENDAHFGVEQYGATRKWPYHISCGGPIYRDTDAGREYALLVRLPKHAGEPETWHLPKGTLHHNETLEACARREIAEESGRIVQTGAYLGCLQARWTMPSGKVMDKATHYFLCLDLHAAPQPHDDEHDRVDWVTADVAIRLLAIEPKREGEIIERAEQWLAQNTDG